MATTASFPATHGGRVLALGQCMHTVPMEDRDRNAAWSRHAEPCTATACNAMRRCSARCCAMPRMNDGRREVLDDRGHLDTEGLGRGHGGSHGGPPRRRGLSDWGARPSHPASSNAGHRVRCRAAVRYSTGCHAIRCQHRLPYNATCCDAKLVGRLASHSVASHCQSTRWPRMRWWPPVRGEGRGGKQPADEPVVLWHWHFS